MPAGHPSDRASPYLGLSFGGDSWGESRDCSVFVSPIYPVPACASWGSPAFVVTAESFGYDEPGTIHFPPRPGEAPSTMLLLEQGARVSTFDSKDARALSAKHFVELYLDAPAPSRVLSLAGFAGSAGALPVTPLWTPRGNGPLLTNDVTTLLSDIDVLVPLTGGSAPVFAGLESALTALSRDAPAGSRYLVAVIGGDDDSGLGEPERLAALESLRLHRIASDVQVILLGAFRNVAPAERRRIAELSEALQAPLVSSGTLYYETAMTTGEQHLYAAIDLAADLLRGERLPKLSATFRVRAPTAGRFAAGSTLRGELYLQSEVCPFDCSEVPLTFAARIP